MKKNIFGQSYREQKRLDRYQEKNRKREKQTQQRLREKAVRNQERLSEERKEYKRKQKVKRDSERRRENHKKKASLLESSGVDLFGLSYSDIEKVSMSEVHAGILNRDTIYKFKRWKFNWDKVYDLSPDSLYIAFRDFAEERRFQDIIEEEEGKMIEQLLADLWLIVNMPVMYARGRHGSSGRAGSGIFAMGSGGRFGSLWESYVRVRGENNHLNSLHRKKSSRVRLKAGRYKGWQVLKNGSRSTFTRVSARKAIVIINGLLWNVVETERAELYYAFMRMVKKHMPDLVELLPTGNEGVM